MIINSFYWALTIIYTLHLSHHHKKSEISSAVYYSSKFYCLCHLGEVTWTTIACVSLSEKPTSKGWYKNWINENI